MPTSNISRKVFKLSTGSRAVHGGFLASLIPISAAPLPCASLIIVAPGLMELPFGLQWQQFMLLGAWKALKQNQVEATARHQKVAEGAQLVAWPLVCAEANATAAYARAVCKEAYNKQNFAHSWLTKDKDYSVWPDAFPTVDFHFWVEYGSWSQCYNCRSYFYNDDYFSQTVYSSPVSHPPQPVQENCVAVHV